MQECVLQTGWEEGGGSGDEAGQPLLDKTDKAALQRQSTVAMLLSFSAQDAPLLIAAFLAGGCACLKWLVPVSVHPALGHISGQCLRA